MYLLAGADSYVDIKILNHFLAMGNVFGVLIFIWFLVSLKSECLLVQLKDEEFVAFMG